MSCVPPHKKNATAIYINNFTLPYVIILKGWRAESWILTKAKSIVYIRQEPCPDKRT